VGTAVGSSHVKGFDGRTGALLASFLAFGPGVSGIDVAGGDVDGDGIAEILASAGPGTSAAVRLFSAAGGVRRELSPYGAFRGGAFRGGVRAGAVDLDSNGRAEIVTGTGPGAPPHVRRFDGLSGAEVDSFFAYAAGFLGGAFVA